MDIEDVSSFVCLLFYIPLSHSHSLFFIPFLPSKLLFSSNGWSYVKRAEFKDLEGNTLDDAIYSESDLSSKKTTIALLKYNNGTDWQ